MPFLGHLEELRWHLIRASVVIGVVFVAFFTKIQWLMDTVILAPLDPGFVTYRNLLCPISPELCPSAGDLHLSLQLLSPTEAFSRALLISFVAALVVCFPYLSWEIWRFVKPGLKRGEVRKTRGILWPISLLFFLGVGFGYFVIAPFSLAFFTHFTLTEQAVQQWRVGPTVSLIVQICFAGGLLFQMPVIAWVLGRLGILQARIMRTYRRHAIVVILILSAVLTPADVFSQLLLAVPMLLLYEMSIWVVARVDRARKKRLAREVAAEPPPASPPTAPPPGNDTPPPPLAPPPPLPEETPPAADPTAPAILPPIHSLPQHRLE